MTADEVFEYVRWAPLLHSTFKSNKTHREMLHTLQDVLDLNRVSMQDFFTKVTFNEFFFDRLESVVSISSIDIRYHCLLNH